MQQTRRQQRCFHTGAIQWLQIAPQRFFDILPVQILFAAVKIVDMPGFNVVDIMHDNVVRHCFQYRVVDDDAVILFGQLHKITVDNAVERVLVAPQYFGINNLIQPPEQLLCQLLLPPLYKVYQQHAGIKVAAILQTDTTAALGFAPVAHRSQHLSLQIGLPQRQDVTFADDVGIKIEDFCYLGRQQIGKQIAVIHRLSDMPGRYDKSHPLGTGDLVKVQCQVTVQLFCL